MAEVRFRRTDAPLKQEVNALGRLLGRIIVEQEGAPALALEEDIRARCKALRGGANGDEAALLATIRSLSCREMATIARAFTLYFHLTNLAEQRHRIRRMRAYERQNKPRPDSLAGTCALLRQRRVAPDQLTTALAGFGLELVLTAHPTQALRRTVLHRLEEIDRGLEAAAAPVAPPQRKEYEDKLLEQIEALWLTNQVRSERLSVLDEVRGTLVYFEDVFFQAIPRLHRELRRVLADAYPELSLEDLPPLVRFASWVGGDADGNPHVNAETVRRTLQLHRHVARTHYLRELDRLFFEFGHDAEMLGAHAGTGAEEALARYRAVWGAPPARLRVEPARELLTYMRRRLEARAQEPPGECPYQNAAEFEDDLRALRGMLARARRSAARVTDLLAAARTFGFHLAALDLRNNSDAHETALAGLLGEEYRRLECGARVAALRRLLAAPPAAGADAEPVAMLRAAAEGQAFAPEAVRNYVISMTRDRSDVWEVLALAAAAGLAHLDEQGRLHSRIHPVPLFETIADLEQAPEVLDQLFGDPAYRGYVQEHGDVQQVMVGYSDSNKDGGYLASHWLLHQAQLRMAETAQRHGVQVEFFHGRGGTVARGGGRAYEAMLALPAGTVAGRLRVTEQGEVISSKYGDPALAERNLELAVSGALLATLGIHPVARRGATRARAAAHTAHAEGRHSLERMSQRSLEAYRAFLNGDLLAFYWQATPVEELGDLNIGSRPTFRRGHADFANLRAIPWVFAWTQTRALMPAWYGLGTALDEELARPGGRARLRRMYRQDVFFHDLIENAAMALGKTDLRITHAYRELAHDRAGAERVLRELAGEFRRAEAGILAVTGEEHLLQRSPVLARSIQLRNPYVDPLSYLQVRLLAEKRAGQLDAEGEQALLLTMQGIAAGMRNTG